VVLVRQHHPVLALEARQLLVREDRKELVSMVERTELEEIRNRPAFVTLLPMEEANRRVTSTAEHLSQSVSFHVKSTGGYGSYSTASIRGSSSRQVSVFIDGVPLNPAQSGAVDFADLPVSSLSRVEVYRGFSAFDLSSASIGGVVNLVTQEPSGTSSQLPRAIRLSRSVSMRASPSLSTMP